MSDTDDVKFEPRKIVTLDDLEGKFSEQSYKAHYEWLRRIITLAAGSLTLLVGLKNNYVHADARDLWLLKSCLGSLAASILVGLLALSGESLKPFEAMVYIQNFRNKHGDTAMLEHIRKYKSPPMHWRFPIYEKTMAIFFVLAVWSGVVFAINNLGQG